MYLLHSGKILCFSPARYPCTFSRKKPARSQYFALCGHLRCGSPARIRRDPRRTCSGMPHGSCRISFWILGSFPDLQVDRVRFLCFLGHSVGLSVLTDPRELGELGSKNQRSRKELFPAHSVGLSFDIRRSIRRGIRVCLCRN